MENNSKVFAMAMFCVLAIAVASNASSEVKHGALAGEDKGDGKPNEAEKVASSPPPTSPPIQNAAPTVQVHTSPPQLSQSLPNSGNVDSSSSESPPSMHSSIKSVPPPGPENLNPGASGKVNTSMNLPTKEEHKDSEPPKKEGDKPVQSPIKDDHKAPQDPEKKGDMTSQGPTKDNVPKGSQGIVESGSSGDVSKEGSCDTVNVTCQTGVLVACLWQSGVESREFFLLVQNTGTDDLNVNLKSPSNIKIDSKSLNLTKHSNKKVNLNVDASKGLKIVLSSGKGKDCVLQYKKSTSDWFNYPQIPSYAAQVRPLHGAYLLFATITIVGGTWACCKFGKKEKIVDAGIPYQQLEMATHTQSASLPANEVPADSWDENWDDDWDDEEAVVRTTAKQPTENAPSNGLSSKSANPNKDGWEIDWDD
ncbi:hypothetical protein M5K25_013689 [Dendrobium thyrsiflorum]|uniref:DUF7356 domain-containing protein n=1 Tax=Dendrobium thyrsiflorum TaxID=117978 RepID=A0ABD0V0G7_DENTH